ncbi:hypothetical protein AB4305_22295 [Nocardia sp. 2YAB30]|uniref:hypothetical protein n=1 Tax=unclassified Nocardia TaxID=2637762 RepID=UPI003F9C0487
MSPENVAAQRTYLGLLRRLGPPATFDAVLIGFLICAHRWTDRTHWTRRTEPTRLDARQRWLARAEILIAPGTELHTFGTSKLFAASYPEAVSVAELIGTLRCGRTGPPTPVRHRDRPPSRRDRPTPCDAQRLDRALDRHDCWRPPGLPIHDYRSLRTFGDPSFRKPHKTVTKPGSPAPTGSPCTAVVAMPCSTTTPSHQ